MLNFIWPIALVVCSNIVYHVSAKSTPEALDPFASLTVTYLVGAAVSFLLYLFIGKGTNIFKECTKLTWAPFALGVCIVGLEAGFIYAYKNGWQVGTAQLVASAALTVALLVIGAVFYSEQLTLQKVLGVLACGAGLFLLTK